jgi:hypothetical protein
LPESQNGTEKENSVSHEAKRGTERVKLNLHQLLPRSRGKTEAETPKKAENSESTEKSAKADKGII